MPNTMLSKVSKVCQTLKTQDPHLCAMFKIVYGTRSNSNQDFINSSSPLCFMENMKELKNVQVTDFLDFLISMENDYVTVVRGSTWFTLKNLIMIEDKLINPIKDDLFRFTIILHILKFCGFQVNSIADGSTLKDCGLSPG